MLQNYDSTVKLTRSKQPLRSRSLGWLAQGCGWLLVFLGMTSMAAALGGMQLFGIWVFIVILSSVAVTAGGDALINLGCRLATIDAVAFLMTDPRPPVVYLRSFRDDEHVQDKTSIFLSRNPSDERVLVDALAHAGPVVAIGCPGERLARLGAARMYVGDDEWQNVMGSILKRARLVILRAGFTAGFWWEVKRVSECVPPERVLIYLHGWIDPDGVGREATWQDFRTTAEGVLPCRLPESGGGASFLSFGPGWTPRPITVPFDPLMHAWNQAGLVVRALKPVLEPLGIQQPRFMPGTIRAVTLALIFLVAGLLVTYLFCLSI